MYDPLPTHIHTHNIHFGLKLSTIIKIAYNKGHIIAWHENRQNTILWIIPHFSKYLKSAKSTSQLGTLQFKIFWQNLQHTSSKPNLTLKPFEAEPEINPRRHSRNVFISKSGLWGYDYDPYRWHLGGIRMIIS